MLLNILYPNLKNFEIFEVDNSSLVINADIIIDSHVCCPFCNSFQIKKHSQYFRKIKEDNFLDKKVTLVIKSAKFFCLNKQCSKKIFCYQLPDLAPKYARISTSLITKIFSLGADISANRLAKALNLNKNTIIYRIRKFESKEIKSSYIGIDDFSFKKRTRYGSLVCDLVSKKVIKIFNDRVDSLEEWLKDKKISIATRDGAAIYKKALSNSECFVQIRDKFHIIQNIISNGKVFFRKLFQISTKKVLEKEAQETLDKIHPDLINQRKFELIMKIKDLYSKNMSYVSITKLTHIDNRTVKKYCHLTELEIEKLCVSQSLISKKKHHIRIDELWKEGVVAEKIYKTLKKEGFKICSATVRIYVAKLKKFLRTSKNLNKEKGLEKTYSISQIEKLFFTKRKNLNKKNLVILKNYFKDNKQCVTFYTFYQNILECFNVKNCKVDSIQNLLILEKHKIFYQNNTSLFFKNLKIDRDGILNAIKYEYTNGLLEGTVNKLKVLKRQMYGRAKFDLLEKKLYLWQN